MYSTHGSNKPMIVGDTLSVADNIVVEHEDDANQMQQISGGFGDSNSMDPATLKAIRENEERAEAILAAMKPMTSEQWEDASMSEEYEMRSDYFNYQEIKSSENFGIKLYKDSFYKGELISNKRHGAGVMVYKKARCYEGYWENDNRHGKGMEIYSNGNKYEGGFRANKPHGKGTYTWVNGEVYEGEWRCGLKDGQGIWRGIFGDSYAGGWKESKADGYGIHQWKNGDKYEGEWKDCLKHGRG